MQVLLGWSLHTPLLLKRRNTLAAPKSTLGVKIEGVYNFSPGWRNVSHPLVEVRPCWMRRSSRHRKGQCAQVASRQENKVDRQFHRTRRNRRPVANHGRSRYRVQTKCRLRKPGNLGGKGNGLQSR
jgi:hypothetical protein